ncbi:MAG: hypothetical protein ACTJHU_09965, partial [Mycetocola sp.]
MTTRRRIGRQILAVAVSTVLAIGSATALSTSASADEAQTPITNASFLWEMSDQYQGGNPANTTCNYFSAGEQTAYSAEQGNVQIVHSSGSGLRLASDKTKCTGSTSGSYRQLMLLTAGQGSANTQTGEATIAWDGTVMANAYGGLVPWSLSELELHVDASGAGELTATLGGYGSSMENPDELTPLDPTPVTLATFPSVSVSDGVLTATPDYAGVEVTIPDGAAAA